MDYKTAYESFLKIAFEEIDYPAAPVVYKLSENQKLTPEYIRDLTNQVQQRIMQLKRLNITMKEEEYRKELELFKLNFLKQCLQSPQVLELARFTPNKWFGSKYINKHKKNMDDYMDILDNANSYMHTIRLILQELWVTKEVDLVI